ncbi:MAG: glycosyltransferase family 4 protein [Saprospiraceae bacterium]|nr:glycosyltransferase family 4 protein [Saprospiraceae bacterium]
MIYAVHLLNDYSGSPKVLSQLVRGWAKAGKEVTVVTSQSSSGFLSDLHGCFYLYHNYIFVSNKWLRLILLFWNQMRLCIILYRKLQKDDIVYINTVLPFGAAIAGKCKGVRVISHIHETSIKPALLKKFLFGVVAKTASQTVYVSRYLADNEGVGNSRYILYNALPDGFGPQKKQNMEKLYRSNVLMICSLKGYKGIHEFLKLAAKNPKYNFRLVVNANESEISNYFVNEKVTSNVEIYPVQNDVKPFYEWSDVVLNLSKPNGWVETFGLTVIEAMAFGRPVIVPPVGGIAELVTDGINGFKADSRNINHISSLLRKILDDEAMYNTMSQSASELVKNYDEASFIRESIQLLEMTTE